MPSWQHDASQKSIQTTAPTCRRNTMKSVLVMSDIHGNLPALEAVLEDAAKREPYQSAWVLGDSVGYGAQPNEVVQLLRKLPNPILVKGNHEAAALADISIGNFNPAAGIAASWTAQALDETTREFLHKIPDVTVCSSVTLCHGTPRDPIWEYLLSPSIAEANLKYFSTPGCVHGHTHVPTIFGRDQSDGWHSIHASDKHTAELAYDRWFVNPGSVGQPRDGDPRASYALLKISEYGQQPPYVQFHRVEYNISRTQDLIISAGLPPALAFRLSVGR